MTNLAIIIDQCLQELNTHHLSNLQKCLSDTILGFLKDNVSPSQLSISLGQIIHSKISFKVVNMEALNRDSIGFTQPTPNTPTIQSISSYLVDAILIFYSLDSELGSSAEEIEKNRARLGSLTESLISQKIIIKSMLIERLDPNDPLDSELLSATKTDPVLYKKKYNVANTHLYYTQTKYNLLREENEGFTKLMVVLCETLPPTISQLWTPIDTPGHLNRQQLLGKRQSLVQETSVLLMDRILGLIGAFELDSNRVLDIVLDMFISRLADQYDFFLYFLQNSPWKTVQGRENRIAHMLGFKFDFYAFKESSAPKELSFVTSILLKHGMVQLGDIYPHLYPSDDRFDEDFKLYQEYLFKVSKNAAKYQGPTLSGTLGDDGKSSQKQTEVSKPEKPPTFDCKNHKADLIETLLLIGDLNNARKMLSRYPKLSSMYPNIAVATCRLLHVILEPIYSVLRPIKYAVVDENAFVPPSPTIRNKIEEHIYVGKRIINPKYTFFYSEWKESLVLVTEYDSLLKVLRNLLVIVGGHLAKDVNLVFKLIRIGKFHLQNTEENQESISKGWLNILSQSLFPALSLTSSNPGLGFELWDFVKMYPYTTRYALYGEWKNYSYKQIPELVVGLTGCEKDTKYIMARLSKETYKQYGRYIGKTGHSNPVIAFSYIVKQLESYDNMISHVVDACRYLTDLELDILSFCIIDALSDRRKRRIEENGTSLAPWLKSLANFCGTLFKKFNVDLEGILRFVYNQLCVQNVYDLLVLQEMTSTMTGIKPVEDVTLSQIQGMAAGETLKREALMFESIKSLSKPSKRLITFLSDSGLVAPIGLLMGSIKRDIIYTTDTNELKVIGWLHDHCKSSFMQYYDFITCHLPIEKYNTCFTTFEELYVKYGIEPSLVFHILRPKLKHLILEYQEQEQDSTTTMEIDYEENDKQEESLVHPCLAETIQQVTKCLPVTLWENMHPIFYVTFWQLSLYDIVHPTQRYKEESQRIQSTISSLDADKSDMSNESVKKRRKEKERLLSCIPLLEAEALVQEKNHKNVLKRLEKERGIWFESSMNHSERTRHLIESCIDPRCLLSPMDATYCANMIYLLHSLKTPGFSTVGLLDKLFSRDLIQVILFQSTESEAKNYGYFLCGCLSWLNRWHKSKADYESEGRGDGLYGFLRKWDHETLSKESILASDVLDHEEFRQAMNKWQQKLRKAFMNSLKSGEYMQIRNSILTLDKINEYFPVTLQTGELIEKIIKDLEENESRKDLKQLARAYYAKLQLRKPFWIPAAEYSILKVKLAAALAMVSAETTPAETPMESRTPMESNVSVSVMESGSILESVVESVAVLESISTDIPPLTSTTNNIQDTKEQDMKQEPKDVEKEIEKISKTIVNQALGRSAYPDKDSNESLKESSKEVVESIESTNTLAPNESTKEAKESKGIKESELDLLRNAVLASKTAKNNQLDKSSLEALPNGSKTNSPGRSTSLGKVASPKRDVSDLRDSRDDKRYKDQRDNQRDKYNYRDNNSRDQIDNRDSYRERDNNNQRDGQNGSRPRDKYESDYNRRNNHNDNKSGYRDSRRTNNDSHESKKKKEEDARPAKVKSVEEYKPDLWTSSSKSEPDKSTNIRKSFSKNTPKDEREERETRPSHRMNESRDERDDRDRKRSSDHSRNNSRSRGDYHKSDKRDRKSEREDSDKRDRRRKDRSREREKDKRKDRSRERDKDRRRKDSSPSIRNESSQSRKRNLNSPNEQHAETSSSKSLSVSLSDSKLDSNKKIKIKRSSGDS